MTLTQAPASVLDLIAQEDGLDDMRALNPAAKSKLLVKLGVVAALIGAGHGNKTALVTAAARTHNVSPATVNNWLGLYRKHGFRGLIDGRPAAAAGRTTLPAVTKGWITDEILRVQRGDGIREVRRMALTQWKKWLRTGDPKYAVPGYQLPPADCGKGYPLGWSYENFRRCQPQAYQAALARQGRIAADRLLPSILGSRVGTAYLEFVFFDDQVYDHHVRAAGYDKLMRPVGFNCLDRLTSYAFAPHIRLRWWDENSDTHKALTQREFVWYAFTFLCREGYRTDHRGTCLIFEHGTANAWSNKKMATRAGEHSFEDALRALTGGHVIIDRSGLYKKAIFKDMLFGPKSAGNPRFKAPIESFFRLVRNYHLHLPAQTGRNADLAPEENYGLVKYEEKLLKLAADLPAELSEAIHSGVWSFREFGALAFLIYDALNSRTDHFLEGWEDCNFSPIRWRFAEDAPDMWRSRQSLAEMPSHIRDLALHQQQHDATLARPFRMCPAEARALVAKDPCIRRLRPEHAWDLMPLEWARKVTVRDKREIWITDPLLGAGAGNELKFLTELTNLRGNTEYLHPGEEVLALVNPFDTDSLLIADLDGTPRGSLVRSVKFGRDADMITDMFRERGRMASALSGGVQRAFASVAEQRVARKAANDALGARMAEDEAEDNEPLRDVTPAAAKPIKRHPTEADPLSASLTQPGADIPDEIDPFV